MVITIQLAIGLGGGIESPFQVNIWCKYGSKWLNGSTVQLNSLFQTACVMLTLLNSWCSCGANRVESMDSMGQMDSVTLIYLTVWTQ